MMNLMNNKKIILVTSGEPGGIGPDICLDLAYMPRSSDYEIVVIGDYELLTIRAKLLNKDISIIPLDDLDKLSSYSIDQKYNHFLFVLHIKCNNLDTIGKLKLENAPYVIAVLNIAINLCKAGKSNTIVTAPLSKEIISRSGYDFTGHTEYFAHAFNCDKVVMMLANSVMKVALLTTHLPLKDVSSYVTKDTLRQTLKIIINAFKHYYSIKNPRIAVCGLNPHAGEGGYLGAEEQAIINPVINEFTAKGYNINGSYPADTIFLKHTEFDVILAMYHDQGLPVLKYSGFADGINITLGLPIIRTSVDHGTALELAGTGKASSTSLISAIKHSLIRGEKC
jgi:4-hydroxythreonine-4-phosphate dehydrogenase